MGALFFLNTNIKSTNISKAGLNSLLSAVCSPIKGHWSFSLKMTLKLPQMFAPYFLQRKLLSDPADIRKSWNEGIFSSQQRQILKKKKKDNKIKNPSIWEGNAWDTERESGFFRLVTPLLWPYCSPFLVSKAAGCRPRKQEKLTYLAYGLKELLFPYACYGIKVLLSTSNSCQTFISFMILVASKMNVHFCGTGQGIRFEMFSIPPEGKSCTGRQR